MAFNALKNVYQKSKLKMVIFNLLRSLKRTIICKGRARDLSRASRDH